MSSAQATPDTADSSASLADQAYERLHRLIVSCRVQPGAWLSEVELRRLSDQPRTPTREAANRLISESLLEVIPRQGYRVAPVSVDSALMLMKLSGQLLGQSMLEARGRVDPDVLDRLRAFVEHPPADDSPGRLDDLIEMSETLSSAVVKANGNPWLAIVLRSLLPHVVRTWTFAWRRPMVELVEHGYGPLLHVLEASADSVDERLLELDLASAWIATETVSGMREAIR
jgi:DNA-binding GntR family transcriptional regulator